MRRGSVLDILEERVPELVQRYQIRSLYLFGSVARDEAKAGSDVDFLVRLEKPSFDNYMGLKLHLEDLLGTQVDLVSARKVPSHIRPQIEREAIRVA